MADKDEPKGLDFVQSLTERFQKAPAWRDLAEACNEVLGAAVENPRRHLARIRESVANRKDDIIEGMRFNDKKGFIVKDHNFPNPANNQMLPPAKVVRVLHNNRTSEDGDIGADALEVEFFIKGKKFNWVLPLDAPQERSIMIQNGYMVGFDFFNTRLSDEDYQRLYEFVSMYWPEGGTDNFIRFISFIKSIALKGIPLWSYDDGSDTFPELEEYDQIREIYPGEKPAYKGGKLYQTSHVELRYDPLAYGNNVQPSLDDLEELFFLFAPIHLVLERIVAAIDMYFDFFYSIACQEMQIYLGKYNWEWEKPVIDHYVDQGGEMHEINQATIHYRWPVLHMESTMQASMQVEIIERDKIDWEIPWLDSTILPEPESQAEAIMLARVAYQWPNLDTVATFLGNTLIEIIAQAKVAYVVERMLPILNFATISNMQTVEIGRKDWPIPPAELEAVHSRFMTQVTYHEFAYAEGALEDYPIVISNSFNAMFGEQIANLIFGNTERAQNIYIETDFKFQGLFTTVFYAKVRSVKTL